MTSYTSSLRLILPDVGSLNNAWGSAVNMSLTALVDSAVSGYVTIAVPDADVTLTSNNGATDQARQAVLNFTGALTAQRNIICPSVSKLYIIKNSTTGGFGLNMTVAGATSTVVVPSGKTMLVWTDGINFFESFNYATNPAFGNPTAQQITVAADPTTNLQVATKHYVDNSIPSGSYLPLTGGTLTGALGGTSAVFSSTVQSSGFTGPLTGNVTGNVSGSSGSCTGNAATATAATSATSATTASTANAGASGFTINGVTAQFIAQGASGTGSTSWGTGTPGTLAPGAVFYQVAAV